MQFEILVRQESPGQFSAQVVGAPEIRCEAATEADALDKVRQGLTDRLTNSKLVRIEVPVAGDRRNPWLDVIGHAANDPTFPEYLEELRRAKEADLVE